MDELQLSFIGGRILLWGISSDPQKIYTPQDRLETFCAGIRPSAGLTRKECVIRMPAEQGVPIVPASMKLFYGQFDVKKPTVKDFRVTGLELSDFQTMRNVLFAPAGP